MIRKSGLVALAGAVFLTIASGCGDKDVSADSKPAASEAKETASSPSARPDPAPASPSAPKRSYQAAPDFHLENVDGGTLRLSSLRGKVVLLDFWATWCGPCRAGIPHLNSLYAEHKKDGFEIVGISVDRGRGAKSGADIVRDFEKKLKLDYPVVMANASTVQSYGGIQSIPTAFLVDREGRIRKRYVGLQPAHVFEKAVKELLAEPSPADEATI